MRKSFAITLDVGSSRANHTGAWRTERPVYVHNLPPCNRAQPDAAVGINSVQRFLSDEALRKGWQVPVDAAAAPGGELPPSTR
jgi:hypothetical protein